MKLLAAIISASALAIPAVFGAAADWTTDLEAAKSQAKKEDKNLLLFFTGSDWCGYCKALDKKVFDKEAFMDEATKSFIPVVLDYPKDKSKQSAELIKENDKLSKEYSVGRRVPTVILTDPEGVPYGKSGFIAPLAEPEKYINHLNQFSELEEKREESLAEANKLTGVEKAKALIGVLNFMSQYQRLDDELIDTFYGDLAEDIKKADPEDTTGFAERMEIKAKLKVVETDLNNYLRAKKHDEALAYVDKVLESGEFEGDTNQQIAFFKYSIYRQKGEFDNSIKAIDEAIALDPESRAGKMLEMNKKKILAQKAKADAKAKEKAEAEAKEKQES